MSAVQVRDPPPIKPLIDGTKSRDGPSSLSLFLFEKWGLEPSFTETRPLDVAPIYCKQSLSVENRPVVFSCIDQPRVFIVVVVPIVGELKIIV